MAISLISIPNTLESTSPYRPTYVDISSNTSAIVRVIADVYVEGIYETTVEKEPILGTTDTFRVEIGEINKKYLSSEFNTHAAAGLIDEFDDVISAKYFHIVAFEVTEVAGVLVTTWAEDGAGTGGYTTSSIYQFNGVNNHLQTLDDWYADGATKHFLTDRPQNSKIINNQKYICGILPQKEAYSGAMDIFEYQLPNANGIPNVNTTGSIQSATRRKLSFTIDPTYLASTTKSIRYRILDNGGLPITEDFVVNVVEGCGDEVNLYWQNHWGEFDQYFFKGNQTEQTKNSTKSITNRLNLSYNTYDRGKKDIIKTNTRIHEVFTETERPEVITWLAEISESVDAYVMVGTDRVSINIVSVTSNIDNNQDGIFQLSVKYTMANERINQIG